MNTTTEALKNKLAYLIIKRNTLSKAGGNIYQIESLNKAIDRLTTTILKAR